MKRKFIAAASAFMIAVASPGVATATPLPKTVNVSSTQAAPNVATLALSSSAFGNSLPLPQIALPNPASFGDLLNKLLIFILGLIGLSFGNLGGLVSTPAPSGGTTPNKQTNTQNPATQQPAPKPEEVEAPAKTYPTITADMTIDGFIRAINQVRAENDAKYPNRASDSLLLERNAMRQATAQKQADYIAATGDIVHSPQGNFYENIYVTFREDYTPEELVAEAVQAWCNSPQHRSAMVVSAYSKTTGVGVAKLQNSPGYAVVLQIGGGR